MKGMKMNGYTDYLQLPSMQMDAIEIDCVIDSVQNLRYFFDARSGMANGYFWTDTLGNNEKGAGVSRIFIDGIETLNVTVNRKVRIRAEFISSFTDDVAVFANQFQTGRQRGVVYTVKCYLAGVLQCAIDFTNNDTAIDVSGNGRHGTLVGGTPVVRSVRKKPRKNLFNGTFEAGSIDSNNGLPKSEADRIRSKNFIEVKPSTQYTFSNDRGLGNPPIFYYDSNFAFLTYAFGASSYVTPANCKYVKFYYGSTGSDTTTKAQMEEGSTATTYEPYTLIPDVRSARTPIKPVQQGLRFNGLTDYVQLPSMQMDSIEIDCMIDGTINMNNKYLIDARSGLANGYMFANDTIGAGWSNVKSNGTTITNGSQIPKNSKVKMNFTAVSTFTDDVKIFDFNSVGSGNERTKGEIYAITCYLAGAVKARYLCNEGTGTTLTDYSGNGNHGTIVGATWVVKKSKQPIRAVQ